MRKETSRRRGPPIVPCFATIARVSRAERGVRVCKVFLPNRSKMFHAETVLSDGALKPDETDAPSLTQPWGDGTELDH